MVLVSSVWRLIVRLPQFTSARRLFSRSEIVKPFEKLETSGRYTIENQYLISKFHNSWGTIDDGFKPSSNDTVQNYETFIKALHSRSQYLLSTEQTRFYLFRWFQVHFGNQPSVIFQFWSSQKTSQAFAFELTSFWWLANMIKLNWRWSSIKPDILEYLYCQHVITNRQKMSVIE